MSFAFIAVFIARYWQVNIPIFGQRDEDGELIIPPM